MIGKPAGKARATPQPRTPAVDNFRKKHLALAKRQIVTEFGPAPVTIDEAESPLAWLARRRGRDGRPLISVHHLQAGERLRADFTLANLMPRTTSNWANPLVSGRRGASGAHANNFTETMIAARQRVHRTLDSVGPEFAGLLIDVCCFLKGLEDVERERAWPARSAKVVLQLALERLSRHYGYAVETCGPAATRMRRWSMEDAEGDAESR